MIEWKILRAVSFFLQLWIGSHGFNIGTYPFVARLIYDCIPQIVGWYERFFRWLIDLCESAVVCAGFVLVFWYWLAAGRMLPLLRLAAKLFWKMDLYMIVIIFQFVSADTLCIAGTCWRKIHSWDQYRTCRFRFCCRCNLCRCDRVEGSRWACLPEFCIIFPTIITPLPLA